MKEIDRKLMKHKNIYDLIPNQRGNYANFYVFATD